MFECNLCEYSCRNRADIFRHCQTKKHLAHFNDEQQKLLLKVIDFIDEKVEIKGIRVNSAGGTGKTFVISSLMKYIPECVALGPTHQSVNMLQKQRFKARTFHSYFGWGKEVNENNIEINIWNPPKIQENTIFVLDEISMMTKAQYSLFKHFIYGKFKFIMMGDKCQIPPFENKQDDILPKNIELIKNRYSNLSLSFQFECFEMSLVKNMRLKNLNLNEQLFTMRNDVLNNRPVFLQNNWKLDYELVKKNINRDYIFIAHQTDYVDKFNNDIRNYLFPENIGSQLCIGDKITLKTFSKATEKNVDEILHKKCYLQGGTRFTISYFEETTIKVPENILLQDEFIEFKSYKIELNDQYIINTLHRDDKYILENWYKDNCKIIKRIKSTKLVPLTDQEVVEMKKKYYKLLRFYKDKNIEWSFSFASTINKAQGASFDLVFVYNFGTQYFSNKHKYTACSRVINDLKIFN